MALQLQSEDLLLAESAEPLAPRVSAVPGAMNAVRKAFTKILVYSDRSGRARTEIPPANATPRQRAMIETLSSVASAEGLDPDDLPAIRVWLRRWIQALGIDEACTDEQLYYRVATLAPSVRSGVRSAPSLTAAPAHEQIEELFDGLVYGQEVLHAPQAPRARPSSGFSMPSAGPVGRFLPPDESVSYEDRLRLLYAKGGSRALAAQYTVDVLRLDRQILQQKPSVEPKGEKDDSPAKNGSPGAPLAA